MPFRQSKSLTHIPLPIAGHTLVQIDDKASLIFSSPAGIQSRLQLWHEVLLTEPDGNIGVISASMWGPTYDLDAAREALSLHLEKVVVAAYAHADGNLDVTFEEGTILQVKPDDYEAWHFQQPAPFSMKRYTKDFHYSCSGYYGGLLQFGSLPRTD